MKKEMKRNLHEYSQILESLHEGIWIIDENANIAFVNSRMAEMLGYTVDEMLGKHMFSFMDEYGKAMAIRNLQRRKLGIAEQHEFDFLDKNGRLVHTLVNVSPIINDKGHFIGTIAGIVDISERKRLEEALQESEEKYRGIFEKVPISIILLDKDGNMVDINPYHITDIGKGETTPEDYLGRNLITDQNIVKAGLSETYARLLKGEPFEARDVYFPTTTGGTDGYFNVRGVPFFKGGEVIGAITIHEDITERKQIEEALRNSEERFRSVVESANDAIISIDSRKNIISWNKAAETAFGYSAEEAVGKPLTFIMPQRFREAFQDRMNQVVASGESNVMGKVVEQVGLRKDGSEFPVELSLAHWKTKEGTFFTAVMRDITKRKRAREGKL